MEDGDWETENEEGSMIFSQIKLDVKEITGEGGSEVFGDEEFEGDFLVLKTKS